MKKESGQKNEGGRMEDKGGILISRKEQRKEGRRRREGRKEDEGERKE